MRCKFLTLVKLANKVSTSQKQKYSPRKRKRGCVSVRKEDPNSDSSDEDVPAEREREKSTEEEDFSTMDMPFVYCAKMCKGLRGLTQHETNCKVFNKLIK